MKKLSKAHPRQKDFDWDNPSEALTAKKRMIELPLDSSRPLAEQVVFPADDLWVPVCIVNGNVHILPGVPRLFTQLLEGYESTLKSKLANPGGEGDHRVIISTPMPESEVAGYLTKLAAQVESRGVKVGSYPRWGKKHNTVTLVGKDRAYIDSLVDDVVKMVDGKLVNKEEEIDSDGEKDNQS
jgi:molybdopterin-biosynthesis enzyme MoeA-like protein